MSFPSAVWLGSPLSLHSKGGKECTTTTSSSSFVVTAARVFLMAALGQVIPQLPVAGRKLLCEAIGTFYLVLTVSMCLQQSEKLFAPIAIGFQLMNQIFAYGYISGGHLNPAVTGGIYFSGLMPLGDAVKYVLSQTTGGVLASLFSWFLVGVSGDFKSPTPATTTALRHRRRLQRHRSWRFAPSCTPASAAAGASRGQRSASGRLHRSRRRPHRQMPPHPNASGCDHRW